jgi:hypothetical protein
MTRKSVGYFDGTDSTLLTSLICAGYDTLPVSNGVDHHGKNVRRINQQEKYDILIGYPHKLYAPVEYDLPYQEVFHICKTYGIPLLLEVPDDLKESAHRLMPDSPDVVEFLDPGEILERALELLRSESESDD